MKATNTRIQPMIVTSLGDKMLSEKCPIRGVAIREDRARTKNGVEIERLRESRKMARVASRVPTM